MSANREMKTIKLKKVKAIDIYNNSGDKQKILPDKKICLLQINPI